MVLNPSHGQESARMKTRITFVTHSTYLPQIQNTSRLRRSTLRPEITSCASRYIWCRDPSDAAIVKGSDEKNQCKELRRANPSNF
ncbi:hypothetical protein RB195_019598 [Necator americanus]|uniref:Uncharacterized protein n=1 Tax=Necator americanus TaxID=51031 RepID=A0ABR1CEX9_NECAM